MVRLVRDKVNRIPVKVTATIDYTGFSATLRVAGANKSLANLKAGNLRLEFTPEEVSEIGEGAEGFITVLNRKGEIHVSNRVWFVAVDTDAEASGYQKISIVLVSMLKYEGGRRPTADSSSASEATEEMIQEKVAAAVEKVMTETITAKVEETVDSVIDTKVEETVTEIVDTKIETAVETKVDSVIESKVETTVNALFDSSDSDTIGGAFTQLQASVEEDIEPRLSVVELDMEEDVKPRLEAAETTLAKKVSMDYEDSDEGVVFFSSAKEDESDSIE